jgi:DNA-binding ferritin-like protein
MHIALEEYYTNIIDIIDSIAEAYQGMTGIIEYKSVKSINNNADAETIIAYFNNLLKFVKTERKSKELSHSWIQNEIDNIEKLIYKIIYKLENL